jgi:hypothetical protein
VGTFKSMGGGSLHNKPIDSNASGAYASGPDDKQMNELYFNHSTDFKNFNIFIIIII